MLRALDNNNAIKKTLVFKWIERLNDDQEYARPERPLTSSFDMMKTLDACGPLSLSIAEKPCQKSVGVECVANCKKSLENDGGFLSKMIT